MKKIGIVFILLPLIFCACQKKEQETSWLDSLYEKGKSTFYQTVEEELDSHPQKDQLSEIEKTKIREAETRYDRLYGILVNVFYQKEAPEMQRLLEKNSRESREDFSQKYMQIVNLAARKFIESFFTVDASTDYILENNPKYENMDAVDMVVQTTGYNAKLDTPEIPEDIPPLNPEFDKQGALDGGKFRDALKKNKGKGIKIAILDTGIDVSHPIFENTAFGEHFSLVGASGKPWANNTLPVDWGFHGTLVSSIAARFAPEAQITMYKFGDGDTQNDPPYQLLLQCIIAASVYKAVYDGNDIISISASGASIDSDYLREACQFAYDNNRVVISGALYSRWFKTGNVLNFPAQYDTVVSVTAADRLDDGSYGYWDVCAPDESISVAAPNDIFGAFPTYFDEEDTYVPSISAGIPTVAALFALTMAEYPRTGEEEPGEYAQEIIDLVIENADPQAVGFSGHTDECGYGLINAEKTVKAAARLNQKRSR